MAKQLEQLKKQIDLLPAKQYAMVLALLVLLAARFVFIPWYQSLVETQDELNQLNSVVKHPEKMAQQLTLVNEQLEELSANKDYWNDKFYVGRESQVKIQFANQVNEWAKKFDLNLLRSKWGRTTKKQQDKYTLLKVQKYEATIRADYKKFLEFVAFVQKQQPLIQISHLSISKRATVGIATTNVSFMILYKEQ